VTQVNLLPTDIDVEQQTRRITALVMGAGVAVVGLLFFIFVLQSARLMHVQDALSETQRTNAGLSTQIASLSRFADLKRNVAAREALLASVESGEVEWSGILRDVSMVQPDQMVLTAMSGSVGGSVSGAQSRAGGSLIGSIQFSGEGIDNPTLAKWLTRLEEVTGWVNPWVGSVTKDQGTGRVTFSGTIDLTGEATIHGVPQ
jgi:Tfp pilus assembly protein PilN